MHNVKKKPKQIYSIHAVCIGRRKTKANVQYVSDIQKPKQTYNTKQIHNEQNQVTLGPSHPIAFLGGVVVDLYSLLQQ